MSNTTKKLEKVEKLLTLLNQGISKKEFVDSFENIVKIVRDIRKNNETEFELIHENLSLVLAKMQKTNTDDLSKTKKQLEKTFQSALADLAEMVNERLSEIRVGEQGLRGEKGAPGNDGSPDSPIDIRNKLETLKDNDRLDIKSIKGSEKILEDLKNSGKQIRFGWGAHPLAIHDEGTLVTKIARKLDFVGSNVSVADTNGTTTVTISSGGGTQISRTIVTTSGNAVMGSTAYTDYVYLVAGAHTMTLPTAISNTNLYTVKNNHSAAITINTSLSQTIDGTATISVQTEDSVDLISNNLNWFVI